MPPQAPVEIWHKILKYAISVPLFFDSDPAEMSGIDSIVDYSWESSYWQSERDRHSLRTVCKAWDAFLKPYAHQFIDMMDVCHDIVPESALPLAIRISFESNAKCRCMEFCTITTDETRLWRHVINDRILERLTRAINTIDNLYGPTMKWNLEIVSEQLTVDRKELEILRHRGPKLMVLVNNDIHNLSANNTLSDSLRVLSIDHTWDFELLDPIGSLRLSNLNTLYFRSPSLEFYSTELALPSLKHLSVDCTFGFQNSFEAENALNSLINTLGQVGNSLETLYFRLNMLEAISVPQGLWEVCPRLLRVQMPCLWNKMLPITHPVRCFRFSIDNYNLFTHAPRPSKLFPSDSIPPLFEARLDQSWRMIIFSRDPHSRNATLTMFLMEDYALYGIDLKDYRGVTFQRFILYILNLRRNPQ